ncbi:chitin deacetylase 1-like isoform X2 [Paramacrobiotus metropolitanus]|uniref:chitin deacetylase 1-like isoform X2 n=1 Tax=Paramacrobiotus metropolitanus TaxID=2943436 RepID=UPI002445679C|nr:chitin deacetylase 1-like isoform X2 [Paramacrobiotus metropolitanus]
MRQVAVIFPVFLLQIVNVYGSEAKLSRRVRQAGALARDVECLKDVGLYRRPVKEWDDPTNPVLTCSDFYECTHLGTVRYSCGKRQRFNVFSGSCDYAKNVNETNCATTSKVGRPQLQAANCPAGQLGCFGKQCIPTEKFCDGNQDCQDGSDEAYCGINDDPNAAPVCDESKCKLPNCFCSQKGTRIPGDLDPAQVPQMIVLSFDDAVNSNVQPIYDALFNPDLKNPNGCPIRGTFYLSHQWTDYRMVQQLFKDGHDFALHSVSHKRPENYWDSGDIIKTYTQEFITNRKIAKEFSQFPDEAYFKGMRVPWLRLGGNRQIQFMQANGILYDHTVSAPPGPAKIWPYTLDYRMPHRCMAANDQSCPTRKFPGSWIFPINQINGSIESGPAKGQYFCTMMEICPARGYDEMLKMLQSNFRAHYETNRAPLGLYFHARWFIDEGHFPALQDFIKQVLSNYTDVYFVTAYQVMNWVQNPTPVNPKMDAFACPARDNVPAACAPAAAACGELPPINNATNTPSGVFFTCRQNANRCPLMYPWIGNWLGMPDTYEKGFEPVGGPPVTAAPAQPQPQQAAAQAAPAQPQPQAPPPPPPPRA